MASKILTILFILIIIIFIIETIYNNPKLDSVSVFDFGWKRFIQSQWNILEKVIIFRF